MKQRARKNPTPRTWTVQTNDTHMLTARLPLDLRDRLRSYVDSTMMTNTDTVIAALDKYLQERGF